jgi:hypothetical protein
MQLSVSQQWTAPRLNRLFLDFKRLGLSTIIIQRSVVGTKAFYASHAFESMQEPPLEAILQYADEFGLTVRVGLAEDPEFWDRIKLASPPDEVETYLRSLRERSLNAARELVPVVSRHRSFGGWFVTEEVDDVNWLQAERRVLLHEHLRDLAETLRSELWASVAISGFSNAHCAPSTLEAFWRDIVDGTGIDLVLFQDGIGAHKLEVASAGQYLAAMKRAAIGSGRALSVVVELFDQVAGPPVSNAPFRAVATGIDRLTQQLSLARDASTVGIIAFSVPDYMVPGAGPSALQLFTDYTTLTSGVIKGNDPKPGAITAVRP